MATMIQTWENLTPPSAVSTEVENWYAVQTYARHEKAVAQRLQERGVPTFLPLVTEVHRWSDRSKVVRLPLFGCYVFAKSAVASAERLRILRVEGVLGLVGNRGEGSPIPEHEIESVRLVLQGHRPWAAHPFLEVGQRVRVRSGALTGIEGVLTSRAGERTLVISIETIQRSLSVRVEGYEVEAA